MKKELGQVFIDWVVSPRDQKAIADYKIDGEQLFFPNANDPGRINYIALQELVEPPSVLARAVEVIE